MSDCDRPNSELTVDECPYREPLSENGGQFAACRLLGNILQTDDTALSYVGRDACEVCCGSEVPTLQRYNSVIASFVHRGARRIIDREGASARDREHAQHLLALAVNEIVRTTLRRPRGHPPENGLSRPFHRLHACDVIVVCRDASEQTVHAVESAVNQDGVRCLVHVIDDGGGASAILRQFAGRDGVLVHRNPDPIGPFPTLIRLLPGLRSRYVAFQDPRSTSRPDRLQWTIGLLEREGGEIGATAVETPGGRRLAQDPSWKPGRAWPWQSMVMRRTTLLDLQRMHGPGVSSPTALIQQALRDGRQLSLGRRVTVDLWDESGACAAAPDRPGAWRPCAPGMEPRPAVDVVLPFHNTVEFVDESLRSVLDQAGVDVVVHLIDDASTVDTSAHLERWARDPRIRVYRNSRNVGPYVSFNNVSRFFETDFVAIQDADDISLPHRLHAAVASLRASQADIFGAAVEMFGDSREWCVKQGGVVSRPVARFRYSRYPAADLIPSVINGSAVLRTSEFVRLGGFTDYGGLECNRCGLDSEFYTRASFAGSHFFISRDVVLRYRRHAQSSTQNGDTGWGTARRRSAREKLLKRIAIWQEYIFDPRDFGALDHYPALTERLT